MLHHVLSGALGLAAWTVLGAPAPQETKPSAALAPPTDDTAGPSADWLDHWAEFIRPSADELRYESIGWRNQFWPAVQLAKELGRPILLWTMNGHPLGCT